MSCSIFLNFACFGRWKPLSRLCLQGRHEGSQRNFGQVRLRSCSRTLFMMLFGCNIDIRLIAFQKLFSFSPAHALLTPSRLPPPPNSTKLRQEWAGARPTNDVLDFGTTPFFRLWRCAFMIVALHECVCVGMQILSCVACLSVKHVTCVLAK